jgi:hypothetical protein
MSCTGRLGELQMPRVQCVRVYGEVGGVGGRWHLELRLLLLRRTSLGVERRSVAALPGLWVDSACGRREGGRKGFLASG